MKLPSKNIRNHENLRFHNSVRPDPAAPGPRKLRTIFPHTSVLSKPPQLPYGANKNGWVAFLVCSVFPGIFPLIPKRGSMEFPKSCKLKIRLFSATRSGGTGSQKVAHHFSAHFRLVKTPSIAICGICFSSEGPY